MSLKIITPEQLANNIKNNVRYKPVDTGDNDMDGFINAFNRAVDQYMFNADDFSNTKDKHDIFLKSGRLTLFISMINDEYLTPESNPIDQTLLPKYQKYVETAGWHISYRAEDIAVRPQNTLILTA